MARPFRPGRATRRSRENIMGKFTGGEGVAIFCILIVIALCLPKK